MLTLSIEEPIILKQNYYGLIVVAIFTLGLTYFASKAWKTTTNNREDAIPGRLGLPFIGETFSFLSAVNSTKGCYDFVRLRRMWYGKWFKTRLFGKVHIFVPSSDGAKTIFANDFVIFNKGLVKSIADVLGEKSLFIAPFESYKRIRHLLSEPFSLTSLSLFISKFDEMLCQRLQKLEESGKSFKVLDFCMKLTFDAMCDMLMSITDESILRQIEKDHDAISEAILSLPVMIPGTKYYRGIMAEQLSLTKMKKEGASLNQEDINNMRYGMKVVKETLRMSNAVSWFPRVALQDCTVDGHVIKKGWHVNIDATCVHYDSDLYKDPFKFHPQRFDEIQKPCSFIPYGSGVRTCPGINMANMTMLVFLHRLTSRYTWTLDDLDSSLEKNTHICRLRSGCPITLKSLTKSMP